MSFQHTAARRRLGKYIPRVNLFKTVSTHSRPKAAGRLPKHCKGIHHVSTHSRPKAAGAFFAPVMAYADVSTHSRPKAAGYGISCWFSVFRVSTHSRPKAAGSRRCSWVGAIMFQHTAARRRLAPLSKALLHQVSQPRFR